MCVCMCVAFKEIKLYATNIGNISSGYTYVQSVFVTYLTNFIFKKFKPDFFFLAEKQLIGTIDFHFSYFLQIV